MSKIIETVATLIRSWQMRLRTVRTESRCQMMDYREGVSLDGYLRNIWDRRKFEHGESTKASVGWPIKTVQTQGAEEARVNVSKLPAKLRRQG